MPLAIPTGYLFTHICERIAQEPKNKEKQTPASGYCSLCNEICMNICFWNLAAQKEEE